jgi:hypothetical protein
LTLEFFDTLAFFFNSRVCLFVCVHS